MLVPIRESKSLWHDTVVPPGVTKRHTTHTAQTKEDLALKLFFELNYKVKLDIVAYVIAFQYEPLCHALKHSSCFGF